MKIASRSLLCIMLFNVVFLQSRVDEDCITELAVHYVIQLCVSTEPS